MSIAILDIYKRWLPLAALVLLVVVTVVIWIPILATTNQSTMTVTFLNVGQGDAILVTSPLGKHILIDGGRDTSVLRELGATLPFWDRTIDMVVVTHPDSDHIGGLANVLQRYNVPTVIQSGVVHTTAVTRNLAAVISKQVQNPLQARRGQIFDFGDGMFMRVLFPDRVAPKLETNTGSVVVQVVYKKNSFLFTGDSPKPVERYLVRIDKKALHSDVLKAGHHGSKTSNSVALIGYTDPSYTVYSRGCHNRYGHPNPVVVARYTQLGIVAFDTCKNGRITFVSDGSTVRATTQR